MALIDSDDTAAVLAELRRRKDEDDADHFHEYELDAGGQLKRLFWADADACLSMALIDIHDVVVVDTTFRTNKYSVPFVPFVGLNHHRRPVVLGCGVVTDQSPDSFAWLMRAFMRSTGQESPKSVITDGSDAVVHAVETVLPLSNHRMCSWQVEQGIREHLGGWSAQEGFRSLMSDDACSPVEFEQRWHAFLASHRTVANQEWLCRMYVKRELWAAAFVRDKFFLGMARDQRTECLATGLHTGLAEGMSLLAMLRHADSWTKHMLVDGYKHDSLADKSREKLTTDHYLEEDAARSFTPANFAILRPEIEAMGDFEIVDTLSSSSNGSGDKVYTVGYHGQHFTVLRCHDRVGGEDDNMQKKASVAFKCSCRKMEREGLPCRHILCVLRHEREPSIPKCCKLRRLLRRGDIRHERLDEMEDLGRQVFDLASQDAREFEEIKDFLEDWLQQRRARR
ncbi:protein FAR1-RELATED SEQUENCE 7-like [Lolium perenne]|uniref:protein FAR1-RELATED SEQUENCE 7-like n=1 Tax=Lolium perenne TaxID=4522 RepID=UPI0021EA883E|nr:protein FAR1-RELATED SEQUENCE 7-like [Lolium perenne]